MCLCHEALVWKHRGMAVQIKCGSTAVMPRGEDVLRKDAHRAFFAMLNLDMLNAFRVVNRKHVLVICTCDPSTNS